LLTLFAVRRLAVRAGGGPAQQRLRVLNVHRCVRGVWQLQWYAASSVPSDCTCCDAQQPACKSTRCSARHTTQHNTTHNTAHATHWEVHHIAHGVAKLLQHTGVVPVPARCDRQTHKKLSHKMTCDTRV
jgi:hypothetical protein